jgi:hypothetical protein
VSGGPTPIWSRSNRTTGYRAAIDLLGELSWRRHDRADKQSGGGSFRQVSGLKGVGAVSPPQLYPLGLGKSVHRLLIGQSTIDLGTAPDVGALNTAPFPYPPKVEFCDKHSFFHARLYEGSSIDVECDRASVQLRRGVICHRNPHCVFEGARPKLRYANVAESGVIVMKLAGIRR